MLYIFIIKNNNEKFHYVYWCIYLSILIIEIIEIIGKGFKSNFKRQISEALHIKEKAPDLNIQKDAYRLSLYD